MIIYCFTQRPKNVRLCIVLLMSSLSGKRQQSCWTTTFLTNPSLCVTISPSVPGFLDVDEHRSYSIRLSQVFGKRVSRAVVCRFRRDDVFFLIFMFCITDDLSTRYSRLSLRTPYFHGVLDASCIVRSFHNETETLFLFLPVYCLPPAT